MRVTTPRRVLIGSAVIADALVRLNGYENTKIAIAVIVEMAGNAKLLEIYRRLINETHLMRRQSISSGQGRLASSQEHRQIVLALGTRDANVAVRALRDHVISGRDRFIAAETASAEENVRTAAVV